MSWVHCIAATLAINDPENEEPNDYLGHFANVIGLRYASPRALPIGLQFLEFGRTMWVF